MADYTSKHTGQAIDDAVDAVSTQSQQIADLQEGLTAEETARRQGDVQLTTRVDNVYTKAESNSRYALKNGDSSLWFSTAGLLIGADGFGVDQNGAAYFRDASADAAVHFPVPSSGDVTLATTAQLAAKADKNGSRTEPFATSELQLATSPGVTADISLTGEYVPSERLPNVINIEIQDPLGELSPRNVKLEVPAENANDKIALQSGVTAVNNAVSALATSVPTAIWVQVLTGLGATYDESTGLFGLNGLTDLTLSEMKTIYRCTHDYRPCYDMASMLSPKYTATGSPIKFRTNFCNSRMLYRDENDAVNMNYFANGNSLLVVCVLYRGNLASERLRPRVMQNTFNGCTKLREIVGVISLALITNRGLLADAFKGCAALESVDLVGLNCAAVGRYASISFADSPALSMESIAYMINNADTADGIVIQLHNTAYNNAKQSVAVVTALAAKTNVTLINADNSYKWCDNTEYHNTGSDAWERYATCLVNSLDGSVVWNQIGPINSGGEQQSGQIG